MNIDLRDKKTLIIVVAAVILVGLLSFWFFGRSSGEEEEISPLIEISSDPVELIIGRELLMSLENMRALQLDVAFLNDPTFDSLQDFTVEITKQPIGRRDPFAPIGR